MKKALKITAGIAAFVLIGGILYLANGLVGNPISKALVQYSVPRYLEQTYPGRDFEIDRINYNFKSGGYYAYIKSKTSIDTHFSLDISLSGKIVNDLYENSVLDKFNTWDRIDAEYRALVESVLESDSFPYESDICFGTIPELYQESEGAPLFGEPYGIIRDELIIDKIYDIRELGEKAGHIVLYVEDDSVDFKTMSKMLLETTRLLDESDIPFYSIDFSLSEPRGDDDQYNANRKELRVNEFLYGDIYAKGLEERLEKAAEALQDYYAKEDSKKAEFESALKE